MKLRPYESRAVREVPRLLAEHRRVVLVGPTGSGKTVATAHVLRAKSLRGKRVLWVAHRGELLDQARRHLLAAGFTAAEIRMHTGSEKHGGPDAAVTVTSIQILGKKFCPKFDVLVIDEAHRALAASYMRLIASRPEALVLGLTATPWRLDGRGLGNVFRHMFVMAITAELIADKHIVAPITFGVPFAKAQAMLRGVKVRAGDYDEEELSKAMRKRTLMGDTVREAARVAPGKATIVFAVDRAHGRLLAARFRKSGRKTEYLDGQTSKDARARILVGLASGAVEVVVSIDVMTEGLDLARVKCIVMCRPTRSLTVYLQQVGRAARPYGRQRAIILDHAGNVWRHKLPQTEHPWSLESRKSRHGAGGNKNDGGRYCAACSAMNEAEATVCANCGEDLGPSARDRSMAEEARVRLEQIKMTKAAREVTMRAIAAAAERVGAGQEWIARVMNASGVL